MQEVQQSLAISKTQIIALHPHSDGSVERYMKKVQEQLRKIILIYQTDWDNWLFTFLPAYIALTPEITSMMPISIVFGWELRLT
jgi:hypothetical protein